MQNIARTEALTSRDAWHARPNTVRGFGVFTLRLSSRSCNHRVFIKNEIYTYLLSVSRPIGFAKTDGASDTYHYRRNTAFLKLHLLCGGCSGRDNGSGNMVKLLPSKLVCLNFP